MSAGPYAIGSGHYPGLGKVVEEFGEALQVLGKLLATNGEPEHWDGTNLHDRLHEEFGDVTGALAFVIDRWHLDRDAITARARVKHALFEQWQAEQVAIPADVLAWVRATYSETGQSLWIDQWRRADDAHRDRMCTLARIPEMGT